jgi:hypothetical protein
MAAELRDEALFKDPAHAFSTLIISSFKKLVHSREKEITVLQ